MDHNKILSVVLAGGKSKRFGEDKSQVKLEGKILIDYILSEIIDEFNETLIVANQNINFIQSSKISLIKDFKEGQGPLGGVLSAMKWIKENKFQNGIVNLSIQHTSASLIVQENADPDVQIDLINYFNNLAPMDDKLYIHTTEGKDDMPAHIKSTLTNNQISLSIKNSELLLGRWQGIYLFEHRLNSQIRMVIHHFIGN